MVKMGSEELHQEGWRIKEVSGGAHTGESLEDRLLNSLQANGQDKMTGILEEDKLQTKNDDATAHVSNWNR